jgi:hypothetical protein
LYKFGVNNSHIIIGVVVGVVAIFWLKNYIQSKNETIAHLDITNNLVNQARANSERNLAETSDNIIREANAVAQTRLNSWTVQQTLNSTTRLQKIETKIYQQDIITAKNSTDLIALKGDLSLIKKDLHLLKDQNTALLLDMKKNFELVFEYVKKNFNKNTSSAGSSLVNDAAKAVTDIVKPS